MKILKSLRQHWVYETFWTKEKRVAGKQGMHGCLGDRGFPYKGNGSYFLGSGKVARPELKDGD